MFERSLVFTSRRAGEGQTDGEKRHGILIPVAARAPIIVRTTTGPEAGADAADTTKLPAPEIKEARLP